MGMLRQELGYPIPILKEFPHVISDKQVSVNVVEAYEG